MSGRAPGRVSRQRHEAVWILFYIDGETIGSIAEQLQLHHSTVRYFVDKVPPPPRFKRDMEVMGITLAREPPPAGKRRTTGRGLSAGSPQRPEDQSRTKPRRSSANSPRAGGNVVPFRPRQGGRAG